MVHICSALQTPWEMDLVALSVEIAVYNFLYTWYLLRWPCLHYLLGIKQMDCRRDEQTNRKRNARYLIFRRLEMLGWGNMWKLRFGERTQIWGKFSSRAPRSFAGFWEAPPNCCCRKTTKQKAQTQRFVHPGVFFTLDFRKAEAILNSFHLSKWKYRYKSFVSHYAFSSLYLNCL